MKKIISTLLIILLLASVVIFPTGCDLFEALFNPPAESPDKPTEDVGSIVPPLSDADNPNVTTPEDGNGGESPSDDKNKPDVTLPDGNDNNNEQPPEIPDEEEFEDYGMNVITIELDNVNVTENGIYNTKEEVGAYIYLYHKLPSNYNDSSSYVKRNYTNSNKLSYTGGQFYNREGLLPTENGRTFTECDIGYNGEKQRNALRIVFSSDWLIFYTDDHYASFSIMRFV